MRRVDQPRLPGTPVGLREQSTSNADAPARNEPAAQPAPERPAGMLRAWPAICLVTGLVARQQRRPLPRPPADQPHPLALFATANPAVPCG